jgi:repressor LexA
MLTKKQYELLKFINKKLNQVGISPSFDEMKVALNLKSKSGIHRLITGLEERGYIRRLPHRARALEVIKLPRIDEERPLKMSLNSNQNNRDNENENSKHISIPLMGKIAAGMPIEAINDPSDTIDVPTNMLSNDEHYALKIDGDSMIEAGIHHEDTVVIRKCDQAENGSIIVALIDNQDATLKLLQKKDKTVELVPANKNYETQIFEADRVKIQGKLAGLIRNYR